VAEFWVDFARGLAAEGFLADKPMILLGNIGFTYFY
jgi:hypothetical protein